MITIYQQRLRIQLETALCNRYCFCNTELRIATVTKNKRTFDSHTTEHVCIIYIIKLTLDERKTKTKNSCTISQRSPMHHTTHHLEHEDPGIIKRQKELGITNGEPTPYARKKHLA